MTTCGFCYDRINISMSCGLAISNMLKWCIGDRGFIKDDLPVIEWCSFDTWSALDNVKHDTNFCHCSTILHCV